MNNIIAITIGDINGIGIELLIKIWKKKNKKNFVLFTNLNLFNKYLKKKNINLKVNQVNKNINQVSFKKDCFNIYSYESNSNVSNTLDSIDNAFIECSKNNFIGMITLPLRKDLIIKNLMKNFIGHTEYLQKLDKKKFSNMILAHKKIIVTPITTHISLKSVSKVTSNKVYLYKKLISIYDTIKKDFNIRNPKLLISGLNPHSGENGKIGVEEEKFIIPTLKKLKKNKYIIAGPVAGDSMINAVNLKKFDCFIFFYHDQALIPFKYISNFSGVNYTGNLNIIRVSPDHGTAYNLLGTNKASDRSLLNCFNLIKTIKNNRNNYEKSKKITEPKFY